MYHLQIEFHLKDIIKLFISLLQIQTILHNQMYNAYQFSHMKYLIIYSEKDSHTNYHQMCLGANGNL